MSGSIKNAATSVASYLKPLTTGIQGGAQQGINGITTSIGGLQGGNTAGSDGSGATDNFGSLLASFTAQSQQSLADQVAMNNAQLQVNQQQQMAQQMAKTAQGSIDKMDVK